MVPPLGGLFPAVIFAGDIPSWWCKLKAVGAFAGTTDLFRLRFPDGIVVVAFPDEGMSNFVEDRVVNIFI